MRLLLLVVVGLATAAMPAAAEPAKKAKPAKRPPKKPPPPPIDDVLGTTPKPGKPPPAPPSANKLRADKLFEDGRRYLEAKEYALACTAFEQSHEADPSTGTVLNLALCYEEWGKLASSYRAYLEAESLAKLKSDDRIVFARKKVDDLTPKVPHLHVDIPADADPGAVFLFDGKEIARERLADDLLVDPGEHSIEARVAGKPPKQTKLELAIGERKRITIDVPKPEVKVIVGDPPRNKARFYGGIGLVAGGTVTVGVASFVALVARQDYADAVGNCPMLRCESRADFNTTQSARDRATYMTFVGGAGVVLVGAGVYLILTSKGQRTSEQQRTVIAPVVGPESIGITIGGPL